MYKYKPRKRRRRALKGQVVGDARTERWRRTLRWRRVIATLAVIAVIAGGVVAYRSSLLRVDEVEVVGATNLTAEQVTALSELKGDSMFTADLARAEERLVSLPLIKGAQAQRAWPNKVRIEVVERQPWGYWNLADTTYVIDAEGVILPDVTPPVGAPVINDTGDPAELSAGDRVDVDAVRLAAELVKAVPETFEMTIARLEYSPASGLTLVTDSDYRVVIGDSQNVDYKLTVWKAVEDDIGRAEMTGHVLDLRFRDRPSFQ